MKIAVTSPNGKTIAGHAGKCPGFLVYETEGDKVVSKNRVKLEKTQVFSQFSGPLSENPEHPLNGIDIFITQSSGGGLKNRLNRDDIQLLITDSSDPDQVIEQLIHSQ
jgi:predicted Fe-Mo cluster-binding NifX family protein